MNRKRLFALAAILLMIGIAVPFAIGWALAAPVQVSVGKAPSDLSAETGEFKSDSGAIVKGWWCPTVNSRSVVLLLPGIRANRLSMVDYARFLRRAGYSVLLIDFQATRNERQSHHFWLEREPRCACRRRFHSSCRSIGSHCNNRQFVRREAVLLATPPLKVDALILESVYPTIEIATRNRMENYLGPIGRTFASLFLTQLHRRIGVSPSQLHPIDHIAAVDCPVLIMSGEKDRNTRPAETRKLFERAQFAKQLWFAPNAGHVNLHQAAPHEYETRVLAFLAQMAQSR